jgi:hypothetical protein
MDPRDAKQFLISRVIQEGELEHVPLSDIEKKMLYFTEVHPSLPDIYEVNAEFERNYDSSEYEAKVARLLKNARDRDGKESPSRELAWEDALDALRKEDHYILVMVGQAFRPGLGTSGGDEHRVRDFLIYVAVAVAVVVVLMLYGAYHS